MRGRPIEPAHGKQQEILGQRLQPYELGEDEPLSHKQLTVAFLASWGFTDQRAADLLGVSVYTVKQHWKIIFLKTGKHNKAGVVGKLLREGIMP